MHDHSDKKYRRFFELLTSGAAHSLVISAAPSKSPNFLPVAPLPSSSFPQPLQNPRASDLRRRSQPRHFRSPCKNFKPLTSLTVSINRFLKMEEREGREEREKECT